MCKKKTNFFFFLLSLPVFLFSPSVRETGGRLVPSPQVELVTFPVIMSLQWTPSKLRSEWNLFLKFFLLKGAHKRALAHTHTNTETRWLTAGCVINIWERILPPALSERIRVRKCDKRSDVKHRDTNCEPFLFSAAVGILVNWAGRTQRGSCSPTATPEALSSSVRAKQPKVLSDGLESV